MITAEDFLAYEGPLPERLGGTEWEVELQSYREPGQIRYLSDYFTEDAIRNAGYLCIPSYMQGATQSRNLQEAWLDTGDRIYIDGILLELSRRENLGITNIAADDIGGMAIVRDIIDGSGEPYQSIHRRAGSGFGQRETLGYHVNLIMPSQLILTEPRLVAEFLASSQSSRTWSWNGTVSDHGYLRSQKAHGIGSRFSFGKTLATTNGSKPMLALHKGAHVDRCNVFNQQWARYEQRDACAPLTGLVSFMNLGANSINLRAVEHLNLIRHMMPDLLFENPVQALHLFSTDLTMRATAETVGGEHITAAEHQKRLAGMAMLVATELQLPADEVEVARRLGGLAAAMLEDEERGDIGGLLRFSAGDLKLVGLRKKAGNKTVLPMDDRITGVDTGFDSVSPVGTGIKAFAKPKFAGLSEEVVPAELIEASRHNLPDSTRARRRGQFVISQPERQKVMHWSRSLGQSEEFKDENAGQRWYDPFDAGTEAEAA